MRNKKLILAVTIAATAFVTAFLYEPVSILIYKAKEPFFSQPIISGSSRIVIRNDAHGNGEFGARRRNGRSHSGIDIMAPVGTPVYAAKSGIAFRGNVPTGYGKYIMIYHPDGYQTYYGHLSDWVVPSTKHIRRGELIGYVGKTGNAAPKSMQPHLHFEIRIDGEPQNPRGLMKNNKEGGI
ncbi:MAG: M23 family metallopeptidase [Candidatus Omnitrophota bacterium]|jgi:murein DD-endopeptidase MepM/ murein hydrolase activator NlpD|nr:M23 family metallopeptidase [Candidatus Omnitrophota bacterium]